MLHAAIAPISSTTQAGRGSEPIVRAAYLLAGRTQSCGCLRADLAAAFEGVTRIVPPGIMGRPSMMWHHDGVACLGRMVTWCDHELVVPELLLGRDAGALIAEVERDPSTTLGAALP